MQVEGLEGQDKLSWMHLSHKLTGLQGMKSDLARAAPGFCHFDFIWFHFPWQPLMGGSSTMSYSLLLVQFSTVGVLLSPCLLSLYLDLFPLGPLRFKGKHGLNSMTCHLRQCFSALSVNPWIPTNPARCQNIGCVDSHLHVVGFWVEGKIFALPDLTLNCPQVASRHSLEWMLINLAHEFQSITLGWKPQR
jgi:hypothetical protein